MGEARKEIFPVAVWLSARVKVSLARYLFNLICKVDDDAGGNLARLQPPPNQNTVAGEKHKATIWLISPVGAGDCIAFAGVSSFMIFGGFYLPILFKIFKLQGFTLVRVVTILIKLI